MKNAVRRLGFWKGIWLRGIFRWQHWQTGELFNWGKPAGLPYQSSVTLDPIGGDVSGVRCACFAPVRGDDGNNRSFITRNFNRVGRKENGTIPF